VIWSTLSENQVIATRPQDYSAQGNAVDVLLRYAQGTLDPEKPPTIPLTDVDRIFLLVIRIYYAAFKPHAKWS